MRIMVMAVTNMMFKLMMIPRIPRLVHSVHPEDDIRRRKKANDTFELTEAAIVKTAAMYPRRSTTWRWWRSRNWTWRPKPDVVASVMSATATVRQTYNGIEAGR